MNGKILISKALNAKEKAYAPYSGFKVGAALITIDGKTITGCNIENISFGATCCAERTAIFNAVSQGYKEFQAIAIVSDSEDRTFPCGICLQVMLEFNISNIFVGNNAGDYTEYKLEDLLPKGFTKF